MVKRVWWGLFLMSCGGKGSVPASPSSAVASPEERLWAEVQSVLNAQVDPCEDFYAFACGGWHEEFELPADRSRYSRSFSAIADRNQDIVRRLLEKPGESADPRLGSFYAACVDVEGIERRGLGSVQADLERIQRAEDGATLVRLMIDLPLANAFFSGFVEPDFKSPDVNMLMLAQGGLGLPTRDDYQPADEDGQAVLADYQGHVGRMLDLAGLDGSRAEDVVQFETALAAVSRSPAQLRDVTSLYHPIRGVEGLEGLSDGVPWRQILATLGLPLDATINVLTPEFFEGLGQLLIETPVETLQAYASWHLLHGAAPYLPSAFDQETFAFFGQRLSGQQQQEPRWKRCATWTDASVGHLLGQAFVDEAFAGDSKAKAVEMIKDVQAAFEEGLPQLAWMDDTTRARARDKLHAITNKIGYPDEWKVYEGLEVGEDAYLNAMAASRWHQADQIGEAGQPVDPGKWYMTPPTVNAYYNPLANEIVFPAGILQPPFFDASYPAAMNYGAMGMVMGHEISHGFDDEGRKFDPQGRLEAWWSEEASAAFEERAQCVEDTYSAIEVLPGVFLQGDLTLGENIADFGGIKLASRALALLRDRQTDPLDGLGDFTAEQLLFVGYAQSWCSEATPEVERLRARTDPHSPPRYRVNVPLSHLPAFWEAFQCEEGQAMRAAEVCEVW